MNNKKIKVLMLGDDIRSSSGVGSQSKYVAEALVKSGKFQVIQLGGAIKHEDPRPAKFHEYGDDLVILPVEGYGNKDIIRSIVRSQKIDLLFFFSDPRFYYWLWEIENEIRPLAPYVYYHVWDGPPAPTFNRSLYESTDVIATISKVTDSIVKTVAPNVEKLYLPHAVDTNIFKKLPDAEIEQFKRENFPEEKDKIIFFWNNRNARRKQSGTLIWWFKEFLDKVGYDKASLIMHTEAKDINGQDLNVIIHSLGLDKNRAVKLSPQKFPPQQLSMIYNAVDCVINISDAEGFGLGTMEALACEKPIIVNMTGGLQEQVTDYSNVEIDEKFMLERNKTKGFKLYEHGIGIEPASRTVIGSQECPFIFEDRLNKEDFIGALEHFINLPKEQRKQLGKNGREHLMKNYNFQAFEQSWVTLMTNIHEKYGSWDSRKLLKTYEMRTF